MSNYQIYIASFWFGCLSILGNLVFGQIPIFSVRDGTGITDVADIANFYGHGASAADYDNDGDIDFYLATTSGVKDRLYQNQGDGTFENVALASGIDISTGSRMAVWFDYNNDQLLDMIVLGERCATFVCGKPILINLYEQNEDRTFTDVTAQSGLDFGERYEGLTTYAAGGMSIGDLNSDGHLDVIITVWGGKVSIFNNNGDGTFVDISESTNIGKEDAFFWQPMCHDFDGDGLIDIFFNVDFGRNQLWLNKDDGTFIENASQTGMATDFSEMGMTISDYDNDGDFDVYSTNITRDFAGEHEHNVLLRNDSESGFLIYNEVGIASKVGDSGWDWGATFFDANNDGWTELASTNGWNNDPNWGPDQSHLWLNTSGSFTDISNEAKFNDLLSATTLIAADLDRDGDLDLLQTLKDNPEIKTPAILYENQLDQLTNKGNYLVVKPRMAEKNHWAIGTVVKMKAGNLNCMRLITAGTSFYGQEPAEAFFGVGTNTMVEKVEIYWPDGRISIYENVATNQVIELTDEVINPPLDLKVSKVEEGIELTWIDQSDNESGFVLEKAITNAFEDVERIEVDANDISKIDILDSSRPFYRIRGFNSKVFSVYSNIINANNVITNSNSPEIQINVFPNPSSGNFTISVGNQYIGEMFLSLIDLSGRTVWKDTILKPNHAIQYQTQIDIGDGVYLLQISLGENQFTQRIQITH